MLDCIDDVATKAELLGYCQAKGLRVIASLGAGLKVGGMCMRMRMRVQGPGGYK